MYENVNTQGDVLDDSRPVPGHTFTTGDVNELVNSATELAGATSGDLAYDSRSKDLTRKLLPFYKDKQYVNIFCHF